MLSRYDVVSPKTALNARRIGTPVESNRRAFTFVELLVVIAVIGILIGLLIPAVQRVRATAERAACANKLQQLAFACLAYHDANDGLPPGVSNGRPYYIMGNWMVSVLPYLGSPELAKAYLHYGVDYGTYRYDHPANVNAVTGKQLVALRCPSDTTNTNGWPRTNNSHVAYHNYVVNFGNTGIDETANWQAPNLDGVAFLGAPFTRKVAVNKRDINDGVSTTLMASEVIIGQGKDLRGNTFWGSGSGFTTLLGPNSTVPDRSWITMEWCNPNPPNPPCRIRSGPYVFAARSRHLGGVNTTFCDGSSRFVTNDVTLTVWRALSTTRGTETDVLP